MKSLVIALLLTVSLYANSAEYWENKLLFKDTPVYELVMVIKNGSARKLEKLLDEKKFDLNYHEKEWGKTVLFVAAETHDCDKIELLLKKGADPNSRNRKKLTVLMTQCACGFNGNFIYRKMYRKVIDLLMKYGADINAIAYSDSTDEFPGYSQMIVNTSPLLEAIPWFNVSSIKYLIAKGADPNLKVIDYNYHSISKSLILRRMSLARFFIIEQKVKIPPYCIITVDNDTIGILRLLRQQTFSLNSRKHKLKMEIINYLKANYGLDYYKEPVSEYMKKTIMDIHPKNWEEYLREY